MALVNSSSLGKGPGTVVDGLMGNGSFQREALVQSFQDQTGSSFDNQQAYMLSRRIDVDQAASMVL